MHWAQGCRGKANSKVFYGVVLALTAVSGRVELPCLVLHFHALN